MPARIPSVAGDLTIIVLAIAVRFAPWDPVWIERAYANGAYPVVDRTVRALTGSVPFCVGDVLFVIAVALLVRYWIRAARRRPRALALARLCLRTTAVAAAIFVWFMLSWAFNYERVPLESKIVVHGERTTPAAVDAFADRTNDRLTALADAAHGERLDQAAVASRLVPTFEATIRRLGDAAPFAPPRVKPTMFQPSLRLSATTGFTDPWTHEVNIESSLFPIERPAVYAHEWAHVAGFADESEANFISVIACTTSKDPLLQYSGWLLVWENLPQGVHLTHRMGRTAYADIEAIRARYLRNVDPRVERASQAAYDTYLKSNHVSAGYASYRIFIRWMTGADFDRDGLPRVENVVAQASGFSARH